MVVYISSSPSLCTRRTYPRRQSVPPGIQQHARHMVGTGWWCRELRVWTPSMWGDSMSP